MPKNRQPFVERELDDKPAARKRLSLKLTEDGTAIDWQATRNPEQALFLLESDPELQARVRRELAPAPFTVTLEHVGFALDLYAGAEAWVLPRVIAKKSKGLIKIPADLASRVCTFTPDQKDKLAPAGAELANQHMPEAVRKWLLQMGPAGTFFGGLFMITMAHSSAMIEAWKRDHAPMVEGVGMPQDAGNGRAAEPTL